MSTSGTYNFSSATVEPIILEAYELNGIIPAQIDDQKIQAAIRSLNFLLSSWTNNKGGLKLWMIRNYMISLVPNQNTYPLPIHTIDIIDAHLRISNRLLGGTPASSSGNAVNAFDGNPQTACIQTAPNGNISYNWNTTSYAVSLVGIQSNTTTTYTLIFEYSVDNVNWFTAYSAPAQVFTQSINVWFAVPTPTMGTVFRVRETGGATLNIQELYFNNFIRDTYLNRMERADYEAIPNKLQPGNPSSYYVDRQITPNVILYLTPNNLYNNMAFTATTQIQDVNALIQQPEIPSRYLDPLVSGLSYRLAMKSLEKAPDNLNKISLYKSIYDESLKLAIEEDRQRTPVRVYGDVLQGGWGRA